MFTDMNYVVLKHVDKILDSAVIVLFVCWQGCCNFKYLKHGGNQGENGVIRVEHSIN